MNLKIGHDPLATFKLASIIYTDTLRVHGLWTKGSHPLALYHLFATLYRNKHHALSNSLYIVIS